MGVFYVHLDDLGLDAVVFILLLELFDLAVVFAGLAIVAFLLSFLALLFERGEMLLDVPQAKAIVLRRNRSKRFIIDDSWHHCLYEIIWRIWDWHFRTPAKNLLQDARRESNRDVLLVYLIVGHMDS